MCTLYSSSTHSFVLNRMAMISNLKIAATSTKNSPCRLCCAINLNQFLMYSYALCIELMNSTGSGGMPVCIVGSVQYLIIDVHKVNKHAVSI